jgi:hypothetical protein
MKIPSSLINFKKRLLKKQSQLSVFLFQKFFDIIVLLQTNQKIDQENLVDFFFLINSFSHNFLKKESLFF